MGYLKLTSSDIRMPAKVTPLPRSSDVNLRARRLAPTPGNGKTHVPGADQLALAQIAQRFAPGSQAQVTREDQRFETRPRAPQVQSAQVAAAPRGMRTLIAALILVALLPSALFAAMIWLGVIHLTWSAPRLMGQATTWPSSSSASVAGALAQEKPQAQPKPEATAATGTAAIPSQTEPSAPAAEQPQPTHVKTLIVLPPPRETAEAARMVSPQTVPEVAADPETTASIASVDDAGKKELPYDTNLIGVVSWDAQSQDLLGATGVEEVFTAPEATAPPPEHLMQSQDAKDDDKNWFTAPQFVNLRKGPTSSSAVISIVAKGAKLEVLGRKRGWVQVANPETSEKGWIYAGSKARRSAKRANKETADGGSFWSGLFGGSSD
ncbi:MAG TPA: SH3 domain-containing protein [Methyloceanibacter sp.]|nr:SH3 domain-containing protein [Methyloceanibacter sp.]